MDGTRPHGTTVSAVASHSLTSPMVLVSLDNGSELLALVRGTGRFGLNILGHSRHGLRPRGPRQIRRHTAWTASQDLPASAAWVAEAGADDPLPPAFLRHAHPAGRLTTGRPAAAERHLPRPFMGPTPTMKRSLDELANLAAGSGKAQSDRPFAPPRRTPA